MQFRNRHFVISGVLNAPPPTPTKIIVAVLYSSLKSPQDLPVFYAPGSMQKRGADGSLAAAEAGACRTHIPTHRTLGDTSGKPTNDTPRDNRDVL